MKKILFLLLGKVLLAATPEESLHDMNQFLKLKNYENVQVQSDFDDDIVIEMETVCARPIHEALRPSEHFKVYYHGQWQDQPFQITDQEPVVAQFSQCIKKEGRTPYLKKILDVSDDAVYFQTSFNETDDFEGKPIDLKVHMGQEKKFLLRMPVFDFKSLTNLDIDKYSYIQFFIHNVIPKFGQFDRYYQSLQDDYQRFYNRQDSVSHTVDYRIPLNIFTIWLTDPTNPKGLSDASQRLITETQQTCKAEFGWRHFLCVNRLSDNPSLAEGKEVIELAPLFDEPAYRSVKDQYECALDVKNFGKASDIARIVVLHKFGGVYQDTDVAIMQSPKRLHQLCDFYGGIESPKALAPGNALMGSKQKHPILESYLRLIAAGCGDLNLPDDLQNRVHRTLFETGPYCLARAYFSGRTDWDVMLPPHVLYFIHYMRTADGPKPRTTWPLCTIARHEHFKDWLK